MATLTLGGLEALLGELGLKIPIPQFQTAEVLYKPLDIGRCYFTDILCALINCDKRVAYNAIQVPGDISAGDLAVILPRLSPGSNSDTLAFDLMKKFPECSLFMLPFPEGVHLRIMFRPKTIPRLLIPYINDRKDSYGRDTSLGFQKQAAPDAGRKRLVVEFSSPNIAREFHAKHLRSTIIGSYISNLYLSMGWDVVKVNYLGDWGKPMGLLGIGWERFGSEELFKSNPARHLLDIYNKTNELFIPELAASKKARDEGRDPAEVEAQGLFAERNAFFKSMEGGDEKAIALWKRVRNVSIENYTNLYAQLNVTFDEYSGESQVSPKTMGEVEEILRSKGLCEESGGSTIIDLKKHTDRTGVVIIRDRAGSSTYLLRDLAAVLDRARKYSFDKMIYVVAADQHTIHFTRLFKVLELMDMADLASKLQHVSFSDVSQMSKKLGNDHLLADILNQSQVAMQDSLNSNPENGNLFGTTKEATSAAGITALLAQELSARRSNDHAFDINQMTKFEPGTGPDLEYWHARLSLILGVDSEVKCLSDEEFTLLEEEEEVNLIRLLAQYPDITHSAYKTLESAPIMAYLTNVTGQLSVCLAKPEDGSTPSPAKTSLYAATRIVLENGLKLLGLATGIN